MATFKAPADFINGNVSLLAKRQSSMYSIFLESKPTFTTYYHVNKIESRTDRGLRQPEALNGIKSPIRYNKLIGFPLYGIEQIQLQLEEEEEGITADYTGECIILPNTIHPTVDDYFKITYLEKHYMFRITKYDYDTIKSNNYYKAEFSIQSVDDDFFNDIESQVVHTYYTQFDNIGTEDKVFLEAEDNTLKNNIKVLYDSLVKDYLENYYYPARHPYNTLIFMQPSTDFNSDWDWIFDENLVHFCNENMLFYTPNSVDTILFYEEKRPYFFMVWNLSIWDLAMHYELARADKINPYYYLEPTAVPSSIFMQWRDKRVKYLREYNNTTNFFGSKTLEYIPANFIAALTAKSVTDLTNPIDIFIADWLIDKTDHTTLLNAMKNIEPHHNDYNFHNFIFIPLLLYCLSDLYNAITSPDPDPLSDELSSEMCDEEA